MKIPSEHDEQVVVCKWLDIIGVTYFSVPNGSFLSGGKMQRARQMKNLKAEGLKSGVPDLVILLEGGKLLFIEMKRVKLSTTSKEQKEWQERLKVLGFSAHICNGAGEAIDTIEKYLPENKKIISKDQGKLF